MREYLCVRVHICGPQRAPVGEEPVHVFYSNVRTCVCAFSTVVNYGLLLAPVTLSLPRHFKADVEVGVRLVAEGCRVGSDEARSALSRQHVPLYSQWGLAVCGAACFGSGSTDGLQSGGICCLPPRHSSERAATRWMLRVPDTTWSPNSSHESQFEEFFYFLWLSDFFPFTNKFCFLYFYFFILTDFLSLSIHFLNLATFLFGVIGGRNFFLRFSKLQIWGHRFHVVKIK